MDLKFHYVQQLIDDNQIITVKESTKTQKSTFSTKLIAPNALKEAKIAVGLLSHDTKEGC